MPADIGRIDSGIYDFVAGGEADEVADGVDIEFADDVGTVCLAGFDTDAEPVGDLLGAIAFGNQLNDFAFARG